MKKILIIIAIVAVLLLSIHFVYFRSRYNVVLITIDTLRADNLSCYNPNAAPTPNIDQLAKTGVLFRKAFSLIPITLPSHTVILSSHSPDELRLFNNGDYYYDVWPLLPDFLGNHHYHTAGFISLPVLSRVFGLGHHFDWFQDNFENCDGRRYKVASEMNAIAVPWIEKHKNNRFFAWIHYSDPHEPYVTVDAPPDTKIRINGVDFGKHCFLKKEVIVLNFVARPGENKVEFLALTAATSAKVQNGKQRYLENRTSITPFGELEMSYGGEWKDFVLPAGIPARYFRTSGVLKVRNNKPFPVAAILRLSGGVKGQRIADIRQNYRAEVQYVDKHIGLFLKKLADLHLESKTIIVLTADHGEGLRTHWNIGHVNCLYNEAIQIPLIIYYPGFGHRGTRVDKMVSHLDIVPTILDLLDISASNLRGHSLKQYVSFWPSIIKVPELQSTLSCTYTPQAFYNAFSLIVGNFKLISAPGRQNQWEAYDLINDPGEKNNLAVSQPDRFNSVEVQKLRRILEQYRNHSEEAHKNHHTPYLEDEDREKLKGLGYVQGNREDKRREKEDDLP